jgi:ubiquinone/menaquinone biosynthesis C-methylase UbiE
VDKPMSNLNFRLMAFGFRMRDIFRPRADVLREVSIGSGAHVLDYGCGPGSYIAPLAELVGPTGQIYALDINPAAIEATKRAAKRKRLENMTTILSDCDTGLQDGSVDAVLLYDTYHGLSQPDEVLRELHRVLKKDGTLSFSDHHMNEHDIVACVTGSGMFEPVNRGRRTYGFAKTGETGVS